jgi:3D (Asp-Asp-Asp) domain-containing protein
VRIHPLVVAAFACFVPVACVTGGAQWIGEVAGEQEPRRAPSAGWSSAQPGAPAEASPPDWIVDPGADPPSRAARAATGEDTLTEGEDGAPPVMIRDHGQPKAAAAEGRPEVFRNTYYDFPSEGSGAKESTIYDAACAPVARVTTDFHDRVCVQGSGRLSDGATVSFARRGCACAAVCPRTSQKICFERLDPARFPSGRGAMGRAITPLRTVAVDSGVIPRGTPLYIPEYVGVTRPDGTAHDGCFLAEDRGIRVVGRHIDVFTGDPSVTARWNARIPSNQGVHVYLNHPLCRPPAPVR